MCVHGLTQSSRIFAGPAERLVALGYRVIAVDLRGHGGSSHDPPWDVATQVDDLLETVGELGIQRASWIGHSLGAVILAHLAARSPEVVERLALLDPTLEAAPARALSAANIERMDWSFTTIDGVVTALLSSDGVVNTPREVVADYVKADVQCGSDGRFRLRYCSSAAVVAWSEMARPAPPVARVPTLIVRPVVPLQDGRPQDRRYRDALGSSLSIVTVPGGHNVLWESPDETLGAIERFFAA